VRALDPLRYCCCVSCARSSPLFSFISACIVDLPRHHVVTALLSFLPKTLPRLGPPCCGFTAQSTPPAPM
jgi:hypothetical protein